jgi:hypothetical protein
MFDADGLFGVALAHDVGFVGQSPDEFWVKREVTFGDE